MKKSERITELEIEVTDLRLLIAKLATRVGLLENAPPSREQIYGPGIPRWTIPFEVTCKEANPTAPAWPFPSTGDKICT
jgi:hypothetical protein